MPPTRPLLIWAWIAIACAVLLAVEGTVLLSGRQRRVRGWRLGPLVLLANVFAVGLAARLYDIHTELIRTRCNCQPFQATEPQIALPVTLATALGSAVLVFTALCSAGMLIVFRRTDAAVAPGSLTRAWSVSGGLVGFVLLADAGAWILTNGVVRLTETAYLVDPVAQGDGLGILPLYSAVTSALCGASLLIVPLVLLLRALRRSGRAAPGSAAQPADGAAV